MMEKEVMQFESKRHKWAVGMRQIVGIFGYLAAFILMIAGKPLYSFFLAIVCSTLFWFSGVIQGNGPGILESDSLLDKIKKRLGVEHVYLKIRKKPLKKIAFGGFAIPLLPFWASIGYNESLNKTETMIHELVHDHYFIYGMQTAVMYVVLMFVMFGLVFKTPWLIAIAILAPIGFMLFQEWLTFTYTHRVAEEFGFEVRQWSHKIFIKYVIYYTVWIGFIAGAIMIGNNIAGGLGIFLMLAYILSVGFLVQKAFYYFGLWFNKNFPDKKNAKFYPKVVPSE